MTTISQESGNLSHGKRKKSPHSFPPINGKINSHSRTCIRGNHCCGCCLRCRCIQFPALISITVDWTRPSSWAGNGQTFPLLAWIHTWAWGGAANWPPSMNFDLFHYVKKISHLERKRPTTLQNHNKNCQTFFRF